MVQLTDPDVQAAINMVWVLVAGIFCFFLQAGFGLLEVGSVRAKNAQNIMLYVSFLGVCVYPFCLVVVVVVVAGVVVVVVANIVTRRAWRILLLSVSFVFAVSQTGSIYVILFAIDTGKIFSMLPSPRYVIGPSDTPLRMVNRSMVSLVIRITFCMIRKIISFGFSNLSLPARRRRL
jgi:hypothetical protein